MGKRGRRAYHSDSDASDAEGACSRPPLKPLKKKATVYRDQDGGSNASDGSDEPSRSSSQLKSPPVKKVSKSPPAKKVSRSTASHVSSKKKSPSTKSHTA
jgi:hypothetical protein